MFEIVVCIVVGAIVVFVVIGLLFDKYCFNRRILPQPEENTYTDLFKN